jgi:hypothetical protein
MTTDLIIKLIEMLVNSEKTEVTTTIIPEETNEQYPI